MDRDTAKGSSASGAPGGTTGGNGSTDALSGGIIEGKTTGGNSSTIINWSETNSGDGWANIKAPQAFQSRRKTGVCLHFWDWNLISDGT